MNEYRLEKLIWAQKEHERISTRETDLDQVEI